MSSDPKPGLTDQELVYLMARTMDRMIDEGSDSVLICERLLRIVERRGE